MQIDILPKEAEYRGREETLSTLSLQDDTHQGPFTLSPAAGTDVGGKGAASAPVSGTE